MIVYFWPSDDHAHDSSNEWSENIDVFDVGEMIPYVDTILREDDKVTNNGAIMNFNIYVQTIQSLNV